MIPKYIQKKILRRAELQGKANILQSEIEEWCAKKGDRVVIFKHPRCFVCRADYDFCSDGTGNKRAV